MTRKFELTKLGAYYGLRRGARDSVLCVKAIKRFFRRAPDNITLTTSEIPIQGKNVIAFDLNKGSSSWWTWGRRGKAKTGVLSIDAEDILNGIAKKDKLGDSFTLWCKFEV